MTHQYMVRAPQELESQAWFMDSDASRHITPHPFNLKYINSYEGPNRVIVGK